LPELGIPDSRVDDVRPKLDVEMDDQDRAIGNKDSRKIERARRALGKERNDQSGGDDERGHQVPHAGERQRRGGRKADWQAEDAANAQANDDERQRQKDFGKGKMESKSDPRGRSNNWRGDCAGRFRRTCHHLFRIATFFGMVVLD
jgi:hypothetical protein